MCMVEPKYTEEAIRLYNLPFTYKPNLTQEEIYKKGRPCCTKKAKGEVDA